MAENIEFIAAKDLPEATGDEVSVLCLENGEMKQKPGSKLGGGGGYILKPTVEEITVTDGTCLQITTDCGELEKVLEAGGSGYIRIPMSALVPELQAAVPYFVMSIAAWGISSLDGTNSLMCHGMVLFGSEATVLSIIFVNGVYVPSWE